MCSMYWYSENNRVLTRCPILSVLSIGSRRSSLSELKAVGPATANAQRPYELRLCQGTTRYWPLAERRCCRLATSNRLECSSRQVYGEALWWRQLCTTNTSLWRKSVEILNYTDTVWLRFRWNDCKVEGTALVVRTASAYRPSLKWDWETVVA